MYTKVGMCPAGLLDILNDRNHCSACEPVEIPVVEPLVPDISSASTWPSTGQCCNNLRVHRYNLQAASTLINYPTDT